MNPTRPQTCLSTETLRQLADDELSPVELADVEDHVSSCELCQTVLAEIATDSKWTDEIEPVLKTPDDLRHMLNDLDDSGIDLPRVDSVLRLLGPTDDPNMLGRIGPYEVVGVIGRGGMGVVFKAFDAALNRFVAIKMLLPHLAESGAARRRFAREGQAAAAVIDDHVLPIYSVADWQGVPYIVTQFLRGSTLQRRIQDRGQLELKEILRIGLQTARGLAAANAQGLVHRDVKPSNILLDGTVERAMLTDFGLARAIDDASITRTGVISGTPQYMSPEQANGEAIDHRSDLFSLGGVIYAMCTGRPPFRADTTFGVLRRIRETPARSIRETNPDIPEWLERIVFKLLEKNAANRFSTANELAVLLEHCLAHVQQPTTVPLPAFCLQKQSPKKDCRVARFTNTKRFALYLAALVLLMLPILLLSLSARPTESPTKSVTTTSTQLEFSPSSVPPPLDAPLDWDAVSSGIQSIKSDVQLLEQSASQDLSTSNQNRSDPLSTNQDEVK